MGLTTLNLMKNYSDKKLFICEHAKSGKCDGIFNDDVKSRKCEHSIPHSRLFFQVGDCTKENTVYCSEAKYRKLKNPRTCIPYKIIEEMLDNKLFEI